jgi:hypothetical protein
MIDRLNQHLKTRKKYNTLKLKYDVKCEELDHKILELNTEKRIKLKQQELYDIKIKELTEENVDLKKKLAEAKKELKELKKNEK